MTVSLRPYQQEAIAAAFEYMSTHDGDPLIVLPTGTGKGVVQASVIKTIMQADSDARVLSITHVKELIEQNYRQMIRLWQSAPAGICSASLGQKDLRSPILFGGIQSIFRHAYKVGRCDLMIVDEAHLMSGKSQSMYGKFISELRTYNPQMRVLGMTATPYRLGTGFLHKGNGAVFSDICYEYSILDAVQQGYLTELRTKETETQLDMRGVPTVGGDYVKNKMEAAVDQEAVNRAVCAEIVARAGNRSGWLVFASGISHAQHLAEILREHGVTCAVIASEGGDDRDQSIAAFKRGEIQCLINVNVLTTGFDAPHVDLIACVRPTKSAGLWVQMLGRGTRLHPDKPDCLVLDFAGNANRFGPIDRIKVTEKSRSGEGEVPIKTCPQCFEIVHAAVRECPGCGYPFPKPEPDLETKAAVAPLLSSQIVPKWHDVTRVSYSRHEKADKPPSLKVTYHTGIYQTVNEWVSIENPRARQMAMKWWFQSNRNVQRLHFPNDVNDALSMVESMAKPVAVSTLPDGKFTRVVGYKWK